MDRATAASNVDLMQQWLVERMQVNVATRFVNGCC
jgi:hypothetical protein